LTCSKTPSTAWTHPAQEAGTAQILAIAAVRVVVAAEIAAAADRNLMLGTLAKLNQTHERIEYRIANPNFSILSTPGLSNHFKNLFLREKLLIASGCFPHFP
jgi:hypothetical protein